MISEPSTETVSLLLAIGSHNPQFCGAGKKNQSHESTYLLYIIRHFHTGYKSKVLSPKYPIRIARLFSPNMAIIGLDPSPYQYRIEENLWDSFIPNT